MLEIEVHNKLRSLLRQIDQPEWLHHLTMARLVARGLRLGKSALIQTRVEHQQYYLSYLTPALLSEKSVILVTPSWLHQQILEIEILLVEQFLNTGKPVITDINDLTVNSEAKLLLISPQIWLEERLKSTNSVFDNLGTIIDYAENLEEEIREFLSITINAQDWYNLLVNNSNNQELIRETLTKLTHSIFTHPPNPYNSYTLDLEEREILTQLGDQLLNCHPQEEKWLNFWRSCREESRIISTNIDRQQGQFTLNSSPVDIINQSQTIWQNHSVVLISSYLEQDKKAPTYCNSLGIDPEKITCLQFSVNYQNQLLNLYLTKNLPFPNSPQFKNAIIKEIMALINTTKFPQNLVVIVVGDVPLKVQITTNLSAQFGSSVVLENKELKNNSILVCGWEFWEDNQRQLPLPNLLIIVTLPIPSLENPLVAAKVAYYKSQGKDWFRFYLLPLAIKEMYNAVLSTRKNQGVVALLDNRVNFRSYGNQFLASLEPFAKIDYANLTDLF
jgi:ATP-dependent DNA helicase DinG